MFCEGREGERSEGLLCLFFGVRVVFVVDIEVLEEIWEGIRPEDVVAERRVHCVDFCEKKRNLAVFNPLSIYI